MAAHRGSSDPPTFCAPITNVHLQVAARPKYVLCSAAIMTHDVTVSPWQQQNDVVLTEVQNTARVGKS